MATIKIVVRQKRIVYDESVSITTFEGERLGRGTLRLDDGRQFKLPGRAD